MVTLVVLLLLLFEICLLVPNKLWLSVFLLVFTGLISISPFLLIEAKLSLLPPPAAGDLALASLATRLA